MTFIRKQDRTPTWSRADEITNTPFESLGILNFWRWWQCFHVLQIFDSSILQYWIITKNITGERENISSEYSVNCSLQNSLPKSLYIFHFETVFYCFINIQGKLTCLNQCQNLEGNRKEASAITGQQPVYYVQLELHLAQHQMYKPPVIFHC